MLQYETLLQKIDVQMQQGRSQDSSQPSLELSPVGLTELHGTLARSCVTSNSTFYWLKYF